MADAPSSLLSAWTNFYVITGSAAAALTGLTFVVITLIAGGRARTSREGVSTFTTPTVVHFCAALFISALLNVPWPALWHAGVALGIVGLYGTVYTLSIARRTARQDSYDPEVEDWVWYTALPLAGYAALVASAVWLHAYRAPALFVPAGATLLLILVGIRNAWDVVTYIAIEKLAAADNSNDSGGESQVA